MPETRTVKGFSEVLLPFAAEDFECCTFDHSDNSPRLFSSGFLSRNLLKNSLERKQERRQKIFDFEIFCVEEYQGESGERNSQLLPKFRVLFALGTFVSAVVGGGSFGNGENPCAATDFGRTDRY